jgi:phage terminase large subunit-like protein
MPRSITNLEDAILGGRLLVRRNPVLTWNNASAVIEQDASANKKWSKRKSTGRIDGIVALSMAVGLAMMADDTPGDPQVLLISNGAEPTYNPFGDDDPWT